jgi:hypothetical protein
VRIDTTKVIDQTGNQYCGPLVVAGVLGISTGEAARKLRGASGKTYIKGVSAAHVVDVLGWSGIRMQREFTELRPLTINMFGRACQIRVGPTFSQWLRGRKDRTGVHIINVGHHFVLVKGNKMVDTFTNGKWVFISAAPHRRKRVTQVWSLEKM